MLVESPEIYPKNLIMFLPIMSATQNESDI
jgi:hypothetical protein